MHIRHDGRVALVTGAAQGIGQAIALGLKDCGAQVHVADLDAARVNAFAQANGFTAAYARRRRTARPPAAVVNGSSARLAGSTSW